MQQSNDSLEAIFHRLLVNTPITKKQQGYVMGAFREAKAKFEEISGEIKARGNSTEVRVEDLIDLLSKLSMDRKVLVGYGHMVIKPEEEKNNENQPTT